jgi:hypothetical protein
MSCDDAEFSCSILFILQSSSNSNNLKDDPNNNNNNKNNNHKKGQVVWTETGTCPSTREETILRPSTRTTSSNSVAGPATATMPGATNRSSARDMLLQDLNELLGEFVALRETVVYGVKYVYIECYSLDYPLA